MVQSPSPSHFGNNKYCDISREGHPCLAGGNKQGLQAQPPRPRPTPQVRPGPPAPSLRAQDDVDAGIREHGPAHLPRPECKGGIFKWLLHLTSAEGTQVSPGLG